MMRYGYRFGLMHFGGFLWFICLVIMIVLAIIIYKAFTTGRRNLNTSSNSNAIKILKERYAKGEIDEEQYNKMKETLEK